MRAGNKIKVLANTLEEDAVTIVILILVNADSAQVVLLTELASLVLKMANSWRTLLVAPIGVQNG